MELIRSDDVKTLIEKWKPSLSLSDWDLRPVIVERDWRKSGDIKIDESNRMAAVMIRFDLSREFLEEVVVHELVHLKLWDLDQMLEEALNALYGEDLENGKRSYIQGQFMDRLETTTQDLTRALLRVDGHAGDFMFDRVNRQVRKEIETARKGPE